jgi:hypothetical protein
MNREQRGDEAKQTVHVVVTLGHNYRGFATLTVDVMSTPELAAVRAASILSCYPPDNMPIQVIVETDVQADLSTDGYGPTLLPPPAPAPPSQDV